MTHTLYDNIFQINFASVTDKNKTHTVGDNDSVSIIM